jgi:putative intracellular protease/amidase
MARVLMPLPAVDFDPTEVAVSWQQLSRDGHDVIFATPDGRAAAPDDIMIHGRGLDPWGWIPGLNRLTLIGRMLRADARGRAAMTALADDPAFATPLRWNDARAADFDALLLPGGHRARGMRAYLESPALQALVVAFFATDKPVAAICHGVLLAARSIDPATGKSVLYGRKTTALTWALERSAATIGRISRYWDPGYYRTYADQPGQPVGYMSVQAEVTRALAHPDDFCDVAADDPDRARKSGGTSRDTPDDGRAAFVIRDGNYVSARWPGDVHLFARIFSETINHYPARG